MKKIMLLSAVISFAVLLVGCSSLQTVDAGQLNGQSLTPAGTSVAHITATTEGLYFFIFPLITGSAKNPGSIAFGENSCNVTAATRMVTKKATQLGATRTTQIVSTSSSVVLPWMLSWKSATVSGNAIR